MPSWWIGFIVGFLVASYVFYYPFRHGINSALIWLLQKIEWLLNKISNRDEDA